MDWFQVLTIAGSIIGACWWMHREHRQDIKNMDAKFNENMKDFHGRLCILEERYLQMMQRILEKNGK